MTVQALPWAIQGQSHSAEVGRNVLASMFGAPVAALTAGIAITTAGGAHGIVGAGDLVVAQKSGGANMSVDIAAGRAVIRSTEAASLAAGAYTFLNDAVVNVVVAAADPTNPRIDLVIAQVRDSNYSGANTDARLTVVTGTPAGAPVPPAVPSSCIVLAQVAVAAAAATIVNGNITDKRTRAYALGGSAVCTSVVKPSGASLFEGLSMVQTDTDRLITYDGAADQRTGWYSAAGRTGGTWRRVAVQSIPNNTSTAVSWDTEDADSDGFLTPTSATVTIPAGLGGLYAVTAECTYGATLNVNVIQISVSGITDPFTFPGDSTTAFQSATVVVPIAAAATVQIKTLHNNGGATNLARARIDLFRIGA